jgi:hypothetical protein
MVWSGFDTNAYGMSDWPSLLNDRSGQVKLLCTSPTGRVEKIEKKLNSKWQDILF